MIQYVVVRGDLLKTLKWPVGALIAQACHACSAVMHLFHEDPNTIEYTKDLDRMHKVILEVRIPLNFFWKKLDCDTDSVLFSNVKVHILLPSYTVHFVEFEQCCTVDTQSYHRLSLRSDPVSLCDCAHYTEHLSFISTVLSTDIIYWVHWSIVISK